jgi:hypothetical protein
VFTDDPFAAVAEHSWAYSLKKEIVPSLFQRMMALLAFWTISWYRLKLSFSWRFFSVVSANKTLIPSDDG